MLNMLRLAIGILSLIILHGVCDAWRSNRTSRGDQGRLIHYLLDTGYDVRVMPFVEDGGPVLFNLSLSLVAISDLDAKTQLLHGSSWLIVDWHDDRLIWDPELYGGIESVIVNIDQTWSPKLYLQNAVQDKPENPIKDEVSQTFITYDGWLHLESPLIHHTSCDLKLDNFPLDEQECWLRFTLQNTPSYLVRLHSAQLHIPQQNISSEWNIMPPHPATKTEYIPLGLVDGINITNEVMHIGFKFKRLPRFYIQNVMLPVTFLSWLSIVVFIIPAKSGERLSASISLVLGVTVFQIVVTDSLPKSSRGGVAMLSVYVQQCFIMSIVVTIMSAIVIKMSHQEGKIKNKIIMTVFFDRLGPWCFVNGRGCCRKKAKGSNPTERCAGGVPPMDACVAGEILSSGGQALHPRGQAWV
ncbi:acetylcholine receptor subunit delta-like, partial [Lytechinus variegatus]|uniref:acetylcholine receptor subunit delta-like n=1 Tax=Lytechinus variegatus TaxID=7654 RepID=UPI001BB21758